MEKVAFIAFGFAIAATGSGCVGDTAAQGQLDGPCFADNTCNSDLTCTTGKCVAPDSDASADDGSTADAADSGPRVCTFQQTFFPCGGQNPAFACYGAGQSCTATGCGADVQWQCFSPNQCASPCCVSSNDATLNAGASCTQGTLVMTPVAEGGIGNGSVCSAGAQCPTGDTQLCQANSQCPTGQICSPIAISGGGLSMKGVVIGACVPQ